MPDPRASRSRRRTRPALALALLAPLLVTPSGCYGSFPLTFAVYELNGEVTDNKWVHTILMWILLILPVYELAFLGDFLILNLIEFWSGETIDLAVDETDGRYRVRIEPVAGGDEILLRIDRDGESIVEQRHVRLDDGSTLVLDRDGNFLGRITQDEAMALAAR